MAFIGVKEMYKVKHPEEYAEKFPEKKEVMEEELDNLTPSERLRSQETKEAKSTGTVAAEKAAAEVKAAAEAAEKPVKTTAELKAERRELEC